MPNSNIFIVMPTYNEAQSIQRVIESLLNFYPNVVVVDDGSTDGTFDLVKDYPVTLMRYILNHEQGAVS